MEKELKDVSQASIAQALAADYFCIYYIDTETDRFVEYSGSEEYDRLGLPKAGDDFISFSRNRFEEHIHPDDRERFLDRFTKEKVVESLDRTGTFTMTFRMLFGEDERYVHIKVTRMIEKEQRHAVIGLSSVDEQMRARAAYEKAHSESITYSRVAQALAGDYFSIYEVDLEDDSFVEYSSIDDYDMLGVEKEGTDFFETSRKNMERLMYHEDLDRFLRVFNRDRVLSIIERDGHFTTKYRLMVSGEPKYVSLKATLLNDSAGAHLIVGTTDIDAQMKREVEYQKLMESARTDVKNDFLANMSHDIRTPMNAIVGYTNIARSNLDDAELVRDSLDKIGSSSHFLLSLINDILDISKIESGKLVLSKERVDLEDVFRRIEDITLLQARNKSLNISYDHTSVKNTHVIADELRLEQVLINITSNAIKYTPDGKDVYLRAEEKDLGNGRILYRFMIKDTGIGISEDYLPHLFESFTREEKTTVNRVQGTGLGLSISARIVEHMGGRIDVKSEPGKGSEFTVEVELERTEDDATDSVEEKPLEDLTGKRILIIEDNDINAEIAAMVLSQFGMTSSVAVNGKEGLDVLEGSEGEYDAVLMDIQMPVMNGYEATRAIRKLSGDYYRDLPIIAMSANAYDQDVRNCLEAGMNDHIAKPFQPEELIRKIARYIYRK